MIEHFRAILVLCRIFISTTCCTVNGWYYIENFCELMELCSFSRVGQVFLHLHPSKIKSCLVSGMKQLAFASVLGDMSRSKLSSV